MWDEHKKAPILEFLWWVFLLWLFSSGVNLLLEPYSILFVQDGRITVGYVVYAIVGILISTPNPMIAIYIVLRRHGQISSVGDFCKRIFKTESIPKTLLITVLFCGSALCAAFFNGMRTDAPWYLFFLALPLMVIGGGVEEVGWRGFLQPAMEKRFPYPIATLLVGVIWYVWHLPIWLMPTSNHYGDSLIGFAITIFVWSFAGSAIYKSTKSVFACVLYHTFINAIGAVYDWNALFDTFPQSIGMTVYYAVLFIGSVLLWVICDRRERKQKS
ncbi:MAG: CPBP family intramembrane glutamic endopeptidase [Eubacteriales bacterium]